MKILGICGSLRNASFNKLLLDQALIQAANQGSITTTFDLSTIPLYNADFDGEQKPAAVQQLIAEIKEADGVVIATPEYNYSLPGVLKNGLDWASRPAYQSVLKDKPIAIMSASLGLVGGARAQIHVRDVLAATLSRIYPAPDFLLATAANAFKADGMLKDETTAAFLANYIEGYIAWIRSGA